MHDPELARTANSTSQLDPPPSYHASPWLIRDTSTNSSDSFLLSQINNPPKRTEQRILRDYGPRDQKSDRRACRKAIWGAIFVVVIIVIGIVRAARVADSRIPFDPFAKPGVWEKGHLQARKEGTQPPNQMRLLISEVRDIIEERHGSLRRSFEPVQPRASLLDSEGISKGVLVKRLPKRRYFERIPVPEPDLLVSRAASIMARMSDDGPLLPMHNLSSDASSNGAPPAYSPPSDPNFYSRSESPSKPLELNTPDSAKRNRRNACICMGVGIVVFVVIPAAVFGGIIAQSHTDCVQKTPGMTGGLADGQKFC
ncbi:uncharacterized protein PAC_16476 [Phialocephala subalpina]|uniref:Transmembrane protein n=1 Tax=Phialocephala subalpina TaxID=576137 RepID=A0A1L7XNF5_9HELO|nr:uncharacterized protein PAC_16476 [Phialocephala subalpina]